MKKNSSARRLNNIQRLSDYYDLVILCGFLGILYYLGSLQFLFVHDISEIFIIAVAAGIFMIAWNSRRFLENHYLLFIGIAYLFMAILNTLHVLTFDKNIFSGASLSKQFWISGEFVQSISLLIAPFFLNHRIRVHLTFWLYAAITLFLVVSIYWNNLFGMYFIDLDFSLVEKASKFIVAGFVLISMVFLWQKRENLGSKILPLIFGSLAMAVIADLISTINSADGTHNLTGHFFQIISFYLIYRAIAEVGLKKPYDLLFRNLKRSEEKYRTVANFTYDWEYWIGPDKKYSYISPSCELVTGYKLKEFMSDFDLLVKITHQDDREMLRGHFHSVLDEKDTKNCHFDFRIITKDGKERWLNHQCQAVFREDGTWLGRRGSNRNITAHKRAEMEIKSHANELENLTADLRKFQLAVENASDLIMIMDTTATILFINKAVEETTGYFKSEIIGKTPALWSERMGKKYYEKIIKEIMVSKKSLTDEVINMRKNKEMYIAELHISPIFDDKGEVIYVVGIERDVTKAKEMDQAKSEFISMASHQLRTPLTSINLAAEMLLKDTAGNREQQKYLREIRDDITGMAALIASLLNVSRIELGTFLINLRPESIKDLATEVLKESYSQIKYKHIKVKKYFDSSLPDINIDRNMMKIIFQNLLSNAIKYTGEKGTITVEIKKQEKDALITVADTGRGIPERQKGKVFTKMFRASNASEIEGVGIGLYIVKSLAVQSGCKIWFESEEGKGTKFYLLVPLSGMEKRK